MKPIRRSAAALLSLAALSLSACITVGPDYKKPELPLPPAYSEPGSDQAIPDTWWTLFGDPVLDRLIEEAFAANQDLAAAAARVEEARALAGITDSDRYPQVTGTAGVARIRQSQETFPVPGFEPERTDVRVSVGASYELDFWGRLRRASEAARAELLASEEGQRNVALSLASEVAAAYLDLAALDRQLEIARGTIDSRGESVRIQRLRSDAGTISDLDLAQSEAELAAIEATVPALERQARQTENRLGVLLGRFGGTVERGKALADLAMPEIPVGLPSQLLARRPDVLAAELDLVAANARIGAARAAYFPDIALTAFAGNESAALSRLLSSGAGVWQVAASLVQPIFNAGRTRRQVQFAQARQRETLALYTRTLQVAFAEVEDALAARRTGVTEREALTRQVDALTRARHLAGLRYDSGESSYFEVLDADRNLFQAELSLARSRRDELAASVALFKALGGGWEEDSTVKEETR